MHGMNPNDDAIDALAGDYVLGTLSAAARREVEARMPHEPALQAAVEAWEQRLHPLVALAQPVEPTAALWQRIDASVSAQSATRAAPRAESRGDGRTSWWHSLGLWRGLAGAGFAAAAVMAAVLVTRVQPPPETQFMVVLVAPQDKAPGWVVQTAAGARQLNLIPLGSITVPSDKSLQFWTKADSWRGPVSLGLVKPGQTLQVPLDKLPPLEANQLFELTLEPANGSPIDRPTGPIQFIGRAVKVL
ncbi:anti-sigma factor [Variovorax saccharolyticus]|uniref:anti-sigma factor n=1 Tax=Variovorax saccharolyticus TaxID=3053516 RepID=UPI002576877B|nr:anti-sigma factor [Variovorax sp. J31P216]MDM0026153.1 anti-sigma factor [Variovorax sp. J31P216]